MKGISEMRSYNNFIRKRLNKQKLADLAFMQERNNGRKYQSEENDEDLCSKVNSIYNMEPFMDEDEKESKKNFKSQVIFRRYKRHNFGKFIRK